MLFSSPITLHRQPVACDCCDAFGHFIHLNFIVHLQLHCYTFDPLKVRYGSLLFSLKRIHRDAMCIVQSYFIPPTFIPLNSCTILIKYAICMLECRNRIMHYGEVGHGHTPKRPTVGIPETKLQIMHLNVYCSVLST